MSSKKFKLQASSARAASSTSSTSFIGGFGTPPAFQTAASPLSYVTELPDLSAISEPKAVVAYKNLTKKDSVTKAKALEELQDYLSQVAESGVENAVLEAWINIYPRTSIDNSRRVRQLAHALQGAFTVATGKRTVPYLPKVIGAWISGTFDSDKVVSRSAQDALEKSFPTQEKQLAVWKFYHRSLVEYAEDAILNQTPQTLSDERTTSPDDAEAKHVRVVGTATLVLCQLLVGNVSGQKDFPGHEMYRSILTNKRLWEFSYHQDAFVRRCVCSLVTVCAARLPSELDWEVVSTCFLSKSLHISQLGSTLQYAEALLAITRTHPSIWTEEYHGKVTASKRLFQYLRQGSQKGPERLWPIMGQLIRRIPLQVWCSQTKPSLEEANTLLAAIHEGVSNSEEPRSNASAAWPTYVDTCFWVADLLESGQETLFEQALTPLIYQYVEESSDQSQWALPAPVALGICCECFVELWKRNRSELIGRTWNALADHLVDAMKLSLPETAREFKASQKSVIARAKRLGLLQVEVTKRIAECSQSIIEANARVFEAASLLLKARNGKPYGAAGVLQELPLASSIRLSDEFLNVELPRLLSSPSGERLVAILLRYCRSSPAFQTSLSATINLFLNNAKLRSTPAYSTLLKGLSNADMAQHVGLEDVVLEDLRSLLKGQTSDWTFVRDIADGPLSDEDQGSELAPAGYRARVIEELMSALSIEDEQEAALQGFDAILSQKQTITRQPSYISELLSKLLLLADSSDERIAGQAAHLSSRVKQLAGSQGSEIVAKSTAELITQQLAGTGQLISSHGLAELAQERIRSAPHESFYLFPTSEHWKTALTPFLNIPPLPASAIVSALQGVVYAVTKGSTSMPLLQRDSDDFSLALRLTVYVTRLLRSTDILKLIKQDQLMSLYIYYPQALHLINEKLLLEPSNEIWATSSPEIVEEMFELLAQGQAMIAKWIKAQEGSNMIDGEILAGEVVRDPILTSEEGLETPNFDGGVDRRATLAAIWLDQLATDGMTGLSATTYNLGVVFASIVSECVSVGGMARYANRLDGHFRSIRSSDDLVRSTSLIVVARDFLATSPQGKKICNELVADATDLKDIDEPIRALRPFVLLNTLMEGDDLLLESVPIQRLVYMVKNLVRLLKSEKTPYSFISEMLKLLCHVVGPISGIYGEHWEDVLEFLVHLWERDNDLNDDLPALHSSLKLHSRLKSLVKENTNEDLVEAWEQKYPSLVGGLLRVLKLFEEPASAATQPRAITTDLLQRQLTNVDLPPGEAVELFPLMASEEQYVQDAAFRLLHRALPQAQQQISLDAILEKKIVHLPDELLSLLLHAPSIQMFSNTYKPREELWLGVRRYLLSWKLVLDHYSNASHQLQGFYTDDIKEGGNLPPLLDFVCGILRMASGKPVNASGFDVKAFDLVSETPLEREVQWLSIHLYYLCLLRLPGLVKDWFIQQNNRIKLPLESWTQKHISPLIVSAALEATSDWAATQVSEDRPVVIKTSPKGSQIIASIDIDEESPPISLVISLPGAYPLEQATITSRNRVVVSEKKWQSWLRTFQVIIFSTGSLIEGLVAFRQNVQGALKGQSECAICYSIIGTDMQTPNKTCGTCKNNFHSACLFRWFKSSNSSSCPLCRNNFNYA